MCEEVYEDETQELANWIGYDNWFHWHCVNITNEPHRTILLEHKQLMNNTFSLFKLHITVVHDVLNHSVHLHLVGHAPVSWP